MKRVLKGVFWFAEACGLGYGTIATCSEMMHSKDMHPEAKIIGVFCTFMLGTALTWAAYAESAGFKIDIK